MNKEETIERYGEAAYERQLAQGRAWKKEHYNSEKAKAYAKEYREEHPKEVKANNQEQCRRDGKYYDKNLEYDRTGLRGERNKIRNKHQKQYRPFKKIIAPDSQIHHEWIPQTDGYRGVALVETDQHMHGIVDVIEILEGKITVLTEEEVKRKQIKKNQEVKKDEQ
jgi:hypothetical protein